MLNSKENKMFKKILLTLAMVLFTCTSAFAAGACVLTATFNGQDYRYKYYVCTADASDGTVANTTVTGFSGYWLTSVETWPGGTAPTDASDMTLLDATTGLDLLGTNGTDLIDATTPGVAGPSIGGTAHELMANGNLTMVVTQQAAATNSAIMNIRITVRKKK
jgi:hypothetical protein